MTHRPPPSTGHGPPSGPNRAAAAAVDDPWAALASWEGVGSAMAAARDGIDALLRDRGLRRTTPESTAESLLRGAHASAVLDGSGSPWERVQAGEGDPTARAAVRVSVELLSLAPAFARSPLQVLARLHTLAARGEVPDADLGRPREPDAAARTADLGRRLVAPTAAPALVVAAVVHAELAVARPFVSHHGIVARAVERLVLVSRGVDPPSATVPEAGHLALRAAYEEGLRGWESGARPGLQGWLLHCAQAYTAGAQASPLHER